MRRRTYTKLLAAAMGAIGLCAQTSMGGSTFYFDTDEATGIQGGTGTWDATATSIDWNPASDGSGIRQAWANPEISCDSAVFNIASTINVAPAVNTLYVNVQDMTFNADTIINSGDGGSDYGRLLPKGIITVANGVSATIGQLQPVNWTTSVAGAMIKDGPGILTINKGGIGRSQVSNHPWIEAGTLKMGGYSAMVGGQNQGPISWSGNLTVDAGATLELNNYQQYMSSPIKGSGIITNTGGSVVDLVMATASSSPSSSVVFAGNLKFGVN